MRNISSSTFSFHVDNLINNNQTFIVENKRDTNSVYVDNKIVLLNKNRKKRYKVNKAHERDMFNFFGQVQKSINKYTVQVDFNIRKIEKRFGSTKKNHEKWREMENGELFYYVDINHCFWRIAFLQSYINKKLYEKILVDERLKQYRNMSLALIIAPKKRKYYVDGKLLNEITEDKSMFRTIYDNIRFTSYNTMGDCMELSKKDFIAYFTDGIMISNKKTLKKVGNFISSKGFNYKVKECCKVDMNHYEYDVLGEKKIKRI